MNKVIIYPDIQAKAIQNPTEEDYFIYESTDHGVLDHETFQELASRKMQELFKTQSYVEQIGNEIWRFKPDGTRELVSRIDKHEESS